MRERFIAHMARRMGLDPAAVLAIASHEGLSGGIGDGGHAFGPGQMNNAGGVLTGKFQGMSPQQINQWAWSNKGIRTWEQGLASVARGLHGRAAINAITTRYERPADPAAEIADAWSHYGKVGHVGGSVQGGGVTPGGNHGPALAQNPTRQNLVQALMQGNTQFMQTGKVDPLLAQSAMQNGLTNQDQAKLGNAPAQKGMKLAGGDLNGVLKTAVHQVGTPYVWGGSKPGGFDCSGLIQFAYAKHGIALPRTTYDMMKVGQKVGWGNFKPGDLIFTNGGDHVVMYLGHGQAISAPHTGANVHTFDVNQIRGDFYSARRVAH